MSDFQKLRGLLTIMCCAIAVNSRLSIDRCRYIFMFFLRTRRGNNDHIGDEDRSHKGDELEDVGNAHFDLFQPCVDDDAHAQRHSQLRDDADEGQMTQPKARHAGRRRERVVVARHEYTP